MYATTDVQVGILSVNCRYGLAKPHDCDAVGYSEHIWQAVTDHDNGQTMFTKAPDQLESGLCLPHSQRGGWFIQQKILVPKATARATAIAWRCPPDMPSTS